MSTPFINCYIFEVKQWPKMGKNLDRYLLVDVYHYNSLTDIKEDKQQSPYMQIPEKFVRNANVDYLLQNLQTIVDNKLPVVKKINDDVWEIDTEGLIIG